MSETITLEFLGRQQTQILREIRNLRSEHEAVRAYTTAHINARAGETEMLMMQQFELMTQQFDRLNDRMDQTERSVEERLRKLEGGP